MIGIPSNAYEAVPGWFHNIDRVLFDLVLTEIKESAESTGDFLELGAYFGKSALFINKYLDSGRSLHVVDLFEDVGTFLGSDDPSIKGYLDAGLSRNEFERNWKLFFTKLPVIHQSRTSAAIRELAGSSIEFLHIDALHTFEGCLQDIVESKRVMRPEGIVVIDDFRTEQHPTVGAAAWSAVLQHGLNPIFCSPHKLYCTWGNAASWLGTVSALLGHVRSINVAPKTLGDREFLCVLGQR